MAAASVDGRVVLGPPAGARVRRCGDPPDDITPATVGACHAHAEGFDLHAGLLVRAGHRDRLERVCRYALPLPLAQERLHRTRDGEIWLTLRHRWADGTTHLRFDPLELLERLAMLTASASQPDSVLRRAGAARRVASGAGPGDVASETFVGGCAWWR